jgi:hypothetical protein
VCRLEKWPQNACLAVPPRQLPFFAKRSQSRWWKDAPVAFYQRATDRGFDVIGVVTRVFAVNLALAALALATSLLPSRMMQFIALSLGAALVAWLLIVFARGPKRG